MQKRRLGNSVLEVAPLTFGGNVFGWTADEAMSHRLLDGFVAAGYNFIDTADVYSRWHTGNKGGESEVIMGSWLKARGNRDQVIIASKLGMDMGGDNKGLSRAYMMRAVEDSLRRLQTDYIDLYQAHRDDPETPLEETLSAFQTLIQQGKVRVIGASNYTAPRLAAALEISKKLGLPRYETHQPQYSIVERTEFEGPLQDLCVRENISVIGYYSLASGFLTGKYRSAADMAGRLRGARVEKYLNAKGFAVLRVLDDIAAIHRAKSGQIALAWLLARPAVAAPIVSATNPEQLAEMVAAPAIKLSAAEITQIDTASRP
ncbi:MAG: aldo/keto reductase [Acetobacteraceae bacterium]|nr:aldo/keto reductase [Acetobacteraceae bacterium]MSP30035.1 aldo/keto reductase [Acetobacteraceae bacterium]